MQILFRLFRHALLDFTNDLLIIDVKFLPSIITLDLLPNTMLQNVTAMF